MVEIVRNRKEKAVKRILGAAAVFAFLTAWPASVLAHGSGGHDGHHSEGHHGHIIDDKTNFPVTVTIKNKTAFNVSLTFVTSLCPRVILKPGESEQVASCFRNALLYHTAVVWYTDSEVVESRAARDNLAVFRAEPNAEWLLLPAE